MNGFYKTFENLRLKPNHEVSQWYMDIHDAKKQVEFLFNHIATEKMLFLGDGDGISILLALKICQEKTNKIKEIAVFDIDQRELNLYDKIVKDNNVNNFVQFKTVHYNISDPTPNLYKGYFDFFYINPPYSYVSEPKGLGFMLWLDRCIEMTMPNAQGCIVHPNTHGEIQEVDLVKRNLEKYLKTNNFIIKGRPRIKHKYLESDCVSKNLIVQRTELSKSKYENAKIPFAVIKSMHPRSKKPPHLIYDDGSEYGKNVDF